MRLCSERLKSRTFINIKYNVKESSTMNECLNCGNQTKSKFCSQSCAAKYQNRNNHWRKQRGILHDGRCLVCGNKTSSKARKFCSSSCARESDWLNITKPKIIEGKCPSGGSLKRYLIEKHTEKCASCGIGPLWNNKKLILQLDHIDGNSDNNLPINLRLLCPNCHTQTETHSRQFSEPKDTKRNNYLRKIRQKKLD